MVSGSLSEIRRRSGNQICIGGNPKFAPWILSLPLPSPLAQHSLMTVVTLPPSPPSAVVNPFLWFWATSSWIKEFNVVKHMPRSLEEDGWNSAEFECVIGLLKNVKFLIVSKCRALVTYDPKDGTFEDLTFPGMPSWIKVIVHEGSLNWIDILLNDT
ncbi:hypothetical protein LWI28_007943 [Acer negundo]|uniref:Uncharacterized protein n=1 Tax=Acer negundo TaxID=4023 RepID=A0AAD5NR58_ACENE|nr:hypothetical protein LWI28_000364 [Acer negundo]KAI9176864.1 hypothetical protein LWI28_007943 [Acer negundo]